MTGIQLFQLVIKKFLQPYLWSESSPRTGNAVGKVCAHFTPMTATVATKSGVSQTFSPRHSKSLKLRSRSSLHQKMSREPQPCPGGEEKGTNCNVHVVDKLRKRVSFTRERRTQTLTREFFSDDRRRGDWLVHRTLNVGCGVT